MRSAFFTLIILILLTACARPAVFTPSRTPATPDTPVPAATETPEPAPTPILPDPPTGLTQYTLQAELDYYAHTLEVNEQVLYPNRTGGELRELVFLVRPALFSYGFDLESITGKDGAVIEGWKLENGSLVIPLAEPLLPLGEAVLNLQFHLTILNREGTLGFTQWQTNLVNWFPILPPYQTGTGWIVHNPSDYGEYMFFDVADFDVRLRFAGESTGLVVAAGAPAVTEDGWQHYRLRAGRTFALSVSPKYRTFEVRSGDVTVVSYWFTDTDAAGKEAASVAARALDLYSQLFGPYPRKFFSVIEADFLDSMEYDGLTLLSRGFYEFYDGTPKTNLTVILPHEVAHQWWYGLVGNDQALEPWLDESTATYCEALYYQHYYPDLLSWWWENRVDSYHPVGWVDATIYNAGGYDPYRNAVYLRGAHFYADLRAAMGDEAFFAFLRAYAHDRAYKIAAGGDFIRLARQFTSADLNPIFKEYFQNPPGD